MKGKRSFSEVIRDLIERKGNSEILAIAFGTRSKAEAEELEKELKEVEEWGAVDAILDTSVIIELFRGNEKILKKLSRNDLVYCSINHNALRTLLRDSEGKRKSVSGKNTEA